MQKTSIVRPLIFYVKIEEVFKSQIMEANDLC